MSKAQHTPGPWAFEIAESGQFEHTPRIVLTPRLMWPGAEYSHPQYTSMRIEAIANARLIASAPDLLEALEKVLARCGQIDPFTEQEARAAIAKAKGA